MQHSVGLALRDHRRVSRLACNSILLLIAAATTGCSWLSPQHADNAPSTPPKLNFDQVSLHRLGCISGNCPVYSVTISGNGDIYYHGDAGVAVRGDRQAHADPKALQQLRKRVLDPDVFWLQSRYTPGHNNCGAWSMNDAAVTLDIQAQRLHKHIDHYLGCHRAPRLLNQIEDAIDHAADVRRWTTAH